MSTSNNYLTLLYTEIRKIVWAFADMVRDKGNSTTEDYAKIVLPTCFVNRTLDLQEELNSKEGASFFELVQIGASSEKHTLNFNIKKYPIKSNNYKTTKI